MVSDGPPRLNSTRIALAARLRAVRVLVALAGDQAPWQLYRDRPGPPYARCSQAPHLRASKWNGAISDSSCTSRFTDAGAVISIPDA
jgi:hypothetical protein